MSTRVLIADGRPELHAAARTALEAADGIEPVEGDTLAHALLEAGTAKPDVILLERAALVLLPTFLGESPLAKVIVIAPDDDPATVGEAFAAGASGYLVEASLGREVVEAVREVAGGGRYVNPELGARLVAAESETRRRAENDSLSEREREVLRLLALGHTNQEIAAQLVISVRTAESHRAHIMEKLGLSSRADLVRYALDRGLLA
jgi:DNA-binding NarL/FixJ family response regulator